MSGYNKQYKKKNLFGQPYPEFVAFMAAWKPKGTVLDVGCGQGRDSLFLAQQGYCVTGIDASDVGVAQMLESASLKDLTIMGIVADFHTHPFTETYDVIVLDSILHFTKGSLLRDLGLLKTLSSHLNIGGIMCLFTHKSKAKEKHLKLFFNTQYPNWRVLKDEYIHYTYVEKAQNFQSSFYYHMYITQKLEA